MKMQICLFAIISFFAVVFFVLPSCTSCESAAKEGKGRSTQPIFGVALDGYPVTLERLNSVAKELDERPESVVFFLAWPDPEEAKEATFSLESLNAIHEHGAVPCLTWEPMYFRDGKEVTIPAETILRGDYDPYIRRAAQALQGWEHPLFLRFAHEMNLDRYHWGTSKEEYGERSPVIYRRIFRHIVNVFRAENAHNVAWVFCPNAESVPGGKGAEWNRIAAYYPGHDYVDVLGMDGYNWGTTQTKEKDGWDSQWREFADIFHSMHAQLREISSSKPLLVFETASVSQGGDRRAWLREAGRMLTEWKLQGLIWFQANKENDWRLQRADFPLLFQGERRSKGTNEPSPIWLRSLVHDKKRTVETNP